MNILVLNAGSSSQKMALYQLNHPLPDRSISPLWKATIDWSDHSRQSEITIKTYTGEVFQETYPETDRETDREIILIQVLDRLWSGHTQVIDNAAAIDCVGHRVVHGGRDYRESVIIDDRVKTAIDQLSTFAPLHNPANLAGILAIETVLGEIPQIAVFDTAFHGQLPEAAKVYPLPYEWYEKGIQRYGFHGISHQYCTHRSAQLLGRDLQELRLIIAHLGNGCSLSAIRNGHSIETTMGFTPLEGLMMGSRSGSIDPGILIYLLREGHYTIDQLDHLLNHDSGLKGLSGISNDLRPILAAIDQDQTRAQLAFDVYVHRLRAQIGAMLANLGGLDALVFTAGVGEHSPTVRSAVCDGLHFLGLQLDPSLNQKTTSDPSDQDLATADSAIRILVIQTQEDWEIARECWHLMSPDQATH